MIDSGSTSYLGTESYRTGYTAGRGDRFLRVPMSTIALESTWEHYATGYKNGYTDATFEIDADRRRKGEHLRKLLDVLRKDVEEYKEGHNV